MRTAIFISAIVISASIESEKAWQEVYEPNSEKTRLCTIMLIAFAIADLIDLFFK